VATIVYKGRRFYSYKCGELNAERYLFAVKAEDAAGKQDSSLAHLSIQPGYTEAEQITILNAESI
jgi:ferredoxin-NADP reductase